MRNHGGTIAGSLVVAVAIAALVVVWVTHGSTDSASPGASTSRPTAAPTKVKPSISPRSSPTAKRVVPAIKPEPSPHGAITPNAAFTRRVWQFENGYQLTGTVARIKALRPYVTVRYMRTITRGPVVKNSDQETLRVVPKKSSMTVMPRKNGRERIVKAYPWGKMVNNGYVTDSFAIRPHYTVWVKTPGGTWKVDRDME